MVFFVGRSAAAGTATVVAFTSVTGDMLQCYSSAGPQPRNRDTINSKAKISITAPELHAESFPCARCCLPSLTPLLKTRKKNSSVAEVAKKAYLV